tara:strand:- start:407 stop:775 length:369 start_codon:yes stop_codon:yes gene_type:complete
MAKIQLISLSGDTLKDIGLDNIKGLVLSNTDNEDITFDLMIGPEKLHNGTATTGCFFILKDIPVPTGSSFVWDDNDILKSSFFSGTSITEYNDSNSKFQATKNLTFLVKLGSGHTGNLVMIR